MRSPRSPFPWPALDRDRIGNATAVCASKWTDWKIVHVQKGPFLAGMLGDPYRWKSEGVLSVMVQESPEKPHQATPLRILDFSVQQK